MLGIMQPMHAWQIYAAAGMQEDVGDQVLAMMQLMHAGMQEDVGKIEVMKVKNVLLARGIYSQYDDTVI